MSDPVLDYYYGEARKELGAAVGFAVAVMAIVTAGLIAWIKWGGPR